VEWSDVAPLTPVLTALITACATLAGVWITQAYANKREVARIAQERESRTTEELRTTARRVSDLLVEEVIYSERTLSNGSDLGDQHAYFEEKYGQHLWTSSLPPIRQAVAMMPDPQARERLDLVLHALTDTRVFPDHYGTKLWSLTAPLVLEVGTALASAYARGEAPDAQTIDQFGDIQRAYRHARHASKAIAQGTHPSKCGKNRSEQEAANED
jgi:hypothetical protein